MSHRARSFHRGFLPHPGGGFGVGWTRTRRAPIRVRRRAAHRRVGARRRARPRRRDRATHRRRFPRRRRRRRFRRLVRLVRLLDVRVRDGSEDRRRGERVGAFGRPSPPPSRRRSSRARPPRVYPRVSRVSPSHSRGPRVGARRRRRADRDRPRADRLGHAPDVRRDGGGGVVVALGRVALGSTADDAAARVGSVAPVALDRARARGARSSSEPARVTGRDVVHVACDRTGTRYYNRRRRTRIAYRSSLGGAWRPTKLSAAGGGRVRVFAASGALPPSLASLAPDVTRDEETAARRGRIRRTRAASSRAVPRAPSSSRRRDDDAAPGRAMDFARRRLRNVRVSFRGRPRRRAAGGASRLGDDSVGAPARVVARRRRHRRRRRRARNSRAHRRDGEARHQPAAAPGTASVVVSSALIRLEATGAHHHDTARPSKLSSSRDPSDAASWSSDGTLMRWHRAPASHRAVARFRHGGGRRRVSPHRSRVPRRWVAARVSLRRRGGDSLGVFQREQGGVRVARARARTRAGPAGSPKAQRTRLLRRVFEFWPPQVGVHVRSQAGGVRPGPEPRTGHGRDGGDGAWRQLFADGGRRRGRGGRRFLFAFLLVPLRSLRRPRESRRRTTRRRRTPPCVVHRRTTSGSSPWKCARDRDPHVVRGDVRVRRRRRRRRLCSRPPASSAEAPSSPSPAPIASRRGNTGATDTETSRSREAAGRLTRVHQRSVRGRGRAAVSIRRRVRHGRHRRVVGADSVRDADVFRRRRRSRSRHGRVHKRGRGLRGGRRRTSNVTHAEAFVLSLEPRAARPTAAGRW